jgi:hypothetical protein
MFLPVSPKCKAGKTAAPEECIDELPTFIPTQLPQFVANYVENRPGYSQYANLLGAGFFKLFFSEPIVEIISKKTNMYADFYRQNPPVSEQARVYIGINLHFGFYPSTVRDDYRRIHKIGQFIGIKRFQQIHRYFSLNSNPITPSNAPWFYRIQAVAELISAMAES